MHQVRFRVFGVYCCLGVALGSGACDDGKPLGPVGPASSADAAGPSGVTDAGADGAPADSATPFVCDVVAPSECPEPRVTYGSVEPIIVERCLACHNGRTEQWPLVDYSDVVDWYDQVRSMMLDCTMPPWDSGVPMPTSEREHILTWIRCGYPE